MKATPRVTARLAGALYVASMVPAGFSVFVIQKLVVRGDPAATATRILGSEGLFRLGFVADLVGILLVIGSVFFLYELFKPVSRSVALFMVLFCMAGSTLQALNSLQDLTALLLLKDGAGPIASTADQARGLALLFLRRHALTYDLALIFFGVFAILIGSLIRASAFLPRILGVLMTIDGLGYLAFSFAMFLAPPLAARLYPYLPMVTAILGEASLMLWLIVKGVNTQRWEEQAGRDLPAA
jgi:hypothetical protein